MFQLGSMAASAFFSALLACHWHACTHQVCLSATCHSVPLQPVTEWAGTVHGNSAGINLFEKPGMCNSHNLSRRPAGHMACMRSQYLRTQHAAGRIQAKLSGSASLGFDQTQS